MAPINHFDGQYAWLSNFYLVPVELDGVTYPCVENAYQAAKTPLKSARRVFEYITAGQAKRAGRKLQLRSDWEAKKVSVMRQLLASKFAPDSQLATLLLETGVRELIEGNTWGDTYWGVCGGRGQNMLGTLLMERRQQLRADHDAD